VCVCVCVCVYILCNCGTEVCCVWFGHACDLQGTTEAKATMTTGAGESNKTERTNPTDVPTHTTYMCFSRSWILDFVKTVFGHYLQNSGESNLLVTRHAGSQGQRL
jgi:hypothetical protein